MSFAGGKVCERYGIQKSNKATKMQGQLSVERNKKEAWMKFEDVS